MEVCGEIENGKSTHLLRKCFQAEDEGIDIKYIPCIFLKLEI